MSFDAKRRERAKALQGLKGNNRSVQLLRPGAKRHAAQARAQAIDERQNGNSTAGRHSLLTDKVERVICECVKAGASLQDACTMAGVGHRTITRWRTLAAEDPESRYGQFLERTEAARTEWKVSAIKKINDSRDWKAAWKLLCARFPLEFRNYLSVNSEISGPDGSPIPIEHSGAFSVLIELASSEDSAPDAPRFTIKPEGESNGE